MTDAASKPKSDKKGANKLAQLLSQGTQTDRESRAKASDFEQKAGASNSEKTLLPIDMIETNPYQPRLHFNPKKIEELAESIRDVGQIQPIAVRLADNGRYQIIAGERRFRAAQHNGQKKIFAVIFDVSDKKMAEMALDENLQREDLSDYEVALALESHRSHFKSHAEMAEYMEKSRQDIYRYLSFTKLPKWITDKLKNNPYLFGRNMSESLVTLMSSSEYQAKKALYDDAIHTALDMLDKDALTQSLFIDHVKRAVRDEVNPRRIGEDAIKYQYEFNGKRVGSFVSDAKGLSIKLNAAILTQEQISDIEAFIVQKLNVDTNKDS